MAQRPDKYGARGHTLGAPPPEQVKQLRQSLIVCRSGTRPNIYFSQV